MRRHQLIQYYFVSCCAARALYAHVQLAALLATASYYKYKIMPSSDSQSYLSMVGVMA